ncbi:MAG: hypothetical protein H0T61_08735 [Actinobacteria bacterium]|nr:hypothetical protein [Actinomycetota bacterium]
MREVVDAESVQAFMRALGAEADEEAVAYLTGGTTAVLVGWRATTVDIDLKLVPESERLLRALVRLKDELGVNVELASPAEFIPIAEGWEERSPFVAREGKLTYRHFDPVAQVLAKLERGHARDLGDVRALIEHGLVDESELLSSFKQIESELYRFPAIDAGAFRRRVEELVDQP